MVLSSDSSASFTSSETMEEIWKFLCYVKLNVLFLFLFYFNKAILEKYRGGRIEVMG